MTAKFSPGLGCRETAKEEMDVEYDQRNRCTRESDGLPLIWNETGGLVAQAVRGANGEEKEMPDVERQRLV